MRFCHIACQPITSLDELSLRMERLAALGYRGIELTLSHPLPYSPEQVLELCERHSLPVASALSGWSYSHEGLCLCSRDANVRRRAVARLTDYARFVAALNSLLVVGLMQGLRSDEPHEEVAQERIVGCLKQVAAAAQDLNASLVVEPVNHLQVGFNHTAAEASALVGQINSPRIGYMLDTIHMNIEEASVVDAIRDHGGKIRHFHLCETNGGPFGTGGLAFSAVLEALEKTGYAGFASIKIYRGVGWEQGAESAAAFLRRQGLWSDAN